MEEPKTEIEEKQRLLTEVEARLNAVDRIKRELSAQAQILRHQLGELKSRPSGTALPPPTGGSERRTTPRRQGNLVSVTIICPASRPTSVPPEASPVASAPGASSMHGWVLNRSGGGLCLLVDEEIAPGTVLTVTPHLGPATFEWIQVEVKSCRPERQSWLLGCQFLQKLSWDDLRPFG
jgi:hypothetical protein